jgi:hypothetical protein
MRMEGRGSAVFYGMVWQSVESRGDCSVPDLSRASNQIKRIE